jgi:hypothetical protein
MVFSWRLFAAALNFFHISFKRHARRFEVRSFAYVISFCSCRVESKRGKIRHVKYWEAALAILAPLCASIALAEDLKTINGKEYKNATVSGVEPDEIVLKTKSEISKVYFSELPQDVERRRDSSTILPFF